MKKMYQLFVLLFLAVSPVFAAVPNSATFDNHALLSISGDNLQKEYVVDVSPLALGSDAAVQEFARYYDNSFHFEYINSTSIKLVLHLDLTAKPALPKAWKMKDYNADFARKQMLFSEMLNSLR